MYNHTMVIYTQYKFHEIPAIAHLLMAGDLKDSLDIDNQRAITPL